MVSNNLVLVKEYEGDDISHMKIYLDMKTKQYKHMYRCPECDKKIQGICWDKLDKAIEDIESMTFFCNRHWFENEFKDSFPEMCEMVDEIAQTKTKYIADRYEMVQSGELYPKATLEYRCQREGELRNEAVSVLKTLTDEQIDKIASEMDCCFDDFSGEVCEI